MKIRTAKNIYGLNLTTKFVLFLECLFFAVGVTFAECSLVAGEACPLFGNENMVDLGKEG